jgi:hypothetical protein
MLTSAAMNMIAFRISKNPIMPQDGTNGFTSDVESASIISPKDSAATDAQPYRQLLAPSGTNNRTSAMAPGSLKLLANVL